MTTTNKQQLFKQLDGFVSELGCAEIRMDELLRELDYADSPDELAEIRELAGQITKDLIKSVNEFNSLIKSKK